MFKSKKREELREVKLEITKAFLQSDQLLNFN